MEATDNAGEGAEVVDDEYPESDEESTNKMRVLTEEEDEDDDEYIESLEREGFLHFFTQFDVKTFRSTIINMKQEASEDSGSVSSEQLSRKVSAK